MSDLSALFSDGVFGDNDALFGGGQFEEAAVEAPAAVAVAASRGGGGGGSFFYALPDREADYSTLLEKWQVEATEVAGRLSGDLRVSKAREARLEEMLELAMEDHESLQEQLLSAQESDAILRGQLQEANQKLLWQEVMAEAEKPSPVVEIATRPVPAAPILDWKTALVVVGGILVLVWLLR